MSKLKEIERLEKSREQASTRAALTVLSLGAAAVAAILIQFMVSGARVPLSVAILFLSPALFASILFLVCGSKDAEKLSYLRNEWLEENSIPKTANFPWPLYSLEESRSRTFMHQEDTYVTVYRLLREAGAIVVTSGDVEFSEVSSKKSERPLYEETENDELWKLIDSNSSTDQD